MRIFNRYVSGYEIALIMGDAGLTFLASLSVRFAVVVVSTGALFHPRWAFWSLQGVAMVLIVILAFYYSDLYAIDQTLSIRELLLRLMGGLGMGCVMIGVVSYPVPEFGKTLYLAEIVVIGLSLFVWRVCAMRLIQRARIHAKVLIIGLQSIGRVVAKELYQRKQLGMEVVGFVDNAGGQVAMSYGNPTTVMLPVFAPSAVLETIERRGIDRILLAGAEVCRDSLAKDLVLLRAKGVPIEDCHSFYERLVSKIPITDLSPEWIFLSKGFRRGRLVMITKRMIDQVVSLVGLVLSLPLSLVVAAAIKLESPGPIFYRQKRVGQDEKTFTLYKFRSMAEGAEVDLGPVWAAQDDPRVTRIGKIIRKLRIDEIPQMYNVLRGEMSFVGPRPERPFFVNGLKSKIPYYDLRHSVKPGITGWAQISYPYGDSEEGAIEKLQYDLYYMKNMSPVFDLQIIFESFKVILLGTGAR